jgi:5-methylcytosine-specific restriction endonuclease McrA
VEYERLDGQRSAFCSDDCRAEWEWRGRARLFARDGWRCYLCGQVLGGREQLQLHHILPYSQGGGDTADNLVSVCSSCNPGQGGDLLLTADLLVVQTELRARNLAHGIPDGTRVRVRRI